MEVGDVGNQEEGERIKVMEAGQPMRVFSRGGAVAEGVGRNVMETFGVLFFDQQWGATRGL